MNWRRFLRVKMRSIIPIIGLPSAIRLGKTMTERPAVYRTHAGKVLHLSFLRSLRLDGDRRVYGAGTTEIINISMGIINRIISGGQTGVDRAALDVAFALGISCGGWCPKGRRAEDGFIPEKYPLTETETRNYNTRTRRNIQDADATLVICHGIPEGGTEFTIRMALAAC